jgi:PQQ-like domain
VSKPRVRSVLGGLICLVLLAGVISGAVFITARSSGASTAALVPEWTYSAGAGSSVAAVDDSADGREVLISSGAPSQITAVDPASGRVLWALATGAQQAESLTSADGVVIAITEGAVSGSTSGPSTEQIWALSESNGTELWGTDLDADMDSRNVVGVSGQLLVELGDNGLFAVSVTSGRTVWQDPNPAGCGYIAGSADDQRIEVLQNCSGTVSAHAVDPTSGRSKWAVSIETAYKNNADSQSPSIATYGQDAVVDWEPDMETLLSPSGNLLARIPVATDPSVNLVDEWELDSTGDLEQVADTSNGLVWTAYDSATGRAIRQTRWAGMSLPSVRGFGSASDASYALVGLPVPVAAEGLYAVDTTTGHSTLYALPTAATSRSTLTVGAADVFVSEQGPAQTDSVVAYNRARLSGTGVPAPSYAAHWPQACSLLPAAKLSAATGHTYDLYGAAPDAGTPSLDASTCRYAPAASGQSGLVVEVVWDGTSSSQTSGLLMEEAESGGAYAYRAADPLSGIGDPAYEASVPPDPGDPDGGNSDTVYVQSGTVLIVLNSSESATLAATAARVMVAGLNNHQGAV